MSSAPNISLASLNKRRTSSGFASLSDSPYDLIGCGSTAQVIDTDTSLFNAELQLAQAYRNTQLALIQLKGPGREHDGQEPVVPAAASDRNQSRTQ
jgi:hypothetical protein